MYIFARSRRARNSKAAPPNPTHRRRRTNHAIATRSALAIAKGIFQRISRGTSAVGEGSGSGLETTPFLESAAERLFGALPTLIRSPARVGISEGATTEEEEGTREAGGRASGAVDFELREPPRQDEPRRPRLAPAVLPQSLRLCPVLPDNPRIGHSFKHTNSFFRNRCAPREGSHKV